MKKILVATDFSTCAANAMEYAMQLANILNLEVCAAHAIGTMEGIFNNTYNALYIEDYYKNKREALTLWTHRFGDSEELKKVPLSTICEVGSVSSVLTKYMNENEVELLVMGTMGSTGISGIFGSNTSTMVEKTKIPILLIPLESKFSKDPVITPASDFDADLSVEDVSALTELMKAFGSRKLTVVNVIEGPEWKTNEKGETHFKQLLSDVELSFNYIRESNPLDGIMRFVVSNQTDILCVVKHHHNLVYRIFNRSTVNQVMNRSIKAILVLHE
jgi:nucleotide-binding universal stress UspA family protein